MEELILVKKKLALLERKKKHPIKSTDKDVADLLALTQQTDLNNVEISSAVLFIAAQKNWIDLTSFVPDLQLAITTASHSHILIYLLCDILRLPNSFNQSGLLKGHPLVSLTINKPELINHSIYGSINLLKKYPDIHSLNITRPFFKYILIQPNSPTTLHMADTLHSQLLLLVMAGHYTAGPLLELLLSLGSFYQCSTVDYLRSTVYRISALCNTVMFSGNKEWIDQYRQQLIHFCLSLCMECTHKRLPIYELISNLKSLFQFERLSVSSCICLSWLLIAHLTDSHIVMSLLEIVQEKLICTEYCSLNLFKLPLVLIISQPFPSSNNKTIRSTAGQILSIIEEERNREREDVFKNDVITVIRPSLSSNYTTLCLMASQYMEYMEGNKTEELLLEFEVTAFHYKFDIVSLGIIMCAMNPVKTDVDKYSLLITANKGGNMGCNMLTYIIYTLGIVKDPQTRFALLKSLPSFCNSTISTELITKTLLTFTKQPDLLPTTIRLLTKAWEKNDKVFTFLRNYLLPPPTTTGCVEWCIASAASLKDICALRPEVHGEECLPYISQLLSYCEHPLMLSLLISALTSLCVSGIIESPSLLWKLLGPQLSKHNNPGIDKGLCEFFSLSVEIKSETEKLEDKVFREESLKYLWKLTLKNDMGTVQTALRTLTIFPINAHTFAVLPDQLITLLNPPTINSDEEIQQSLINVNSSQLLLLFIALTKPLNNSSNCLDELVEYLVKNELESLPRGVVFNAVKKLNSFSIISDKTQKGLAEFLTSTESSFKRGPTALYLLNELRKEHSSTFTKRRDYLIQVVKNTAELSCHDNLWVFNEGILWSQLMNELIDVEIKCSSSKNVIDKGEKKVEIITKAINRVLSMLKELVRCQSSYISMGMIMGVVCSDISLETTPEFLTSLLHHMSCFIKTRTLPHHSGPLYELIKILLAVITPDDFIKCLLVYIPVLSHCICKYSWQALEAREQLTELISALNDFILRSQGSLNVQLACSGLMYFVQDLPYCREIISDSFRSVTGLQSEVSNEFPLLLLCVKGDRHSLIIEKLIENITSKSMPIECIKSISLHVSTNLPLLVFTGSVSFENAQKCVQVLAELATTYDQIPELHLSLGILVHDLYMTGVGLNFGQLMESLAVKWIQEGLANVNHISDTNQVLSPMYGIAGLLGLSKLNHKLTGCINDSFIQLLLSTGLPFLYQCCRISNESIQNSALCIITLIYTKFVYNSDEKREDVIPNDYSYLPEGNALNIIYDQLYKYCTQSNVIIDDQQAAEIIKGLSLIKSPLPPVKWEFILLPIMSKNEKCQEWVVEFVLTQASLNNYKINIKNVVNFIIHPMMFHSLKETVKSQVINGLIHIMEFISFSQIFLLLTSTITNQIECCVESLLSLLSSDKVTTPGCFKSNLSSVLVQACSILELELKDTSLDKKSFQPLADSTFFYTLSQCFSLVDISVPDFLKRTITFCHIIIRDKNLILDLFDYLDNSTSSFSLLEKKWFMYTLQSLCSKQNNSYNEILLLTKLQEWSKEHTKPTDEQLNTLLLLISTIIGGKYITAQSIMWPSIDTLHEGVIQKLCELAIFWLCEDRQPFHSIIKGLVCNLRHTSGFNKMNMWTSVAHLL